MSQYVFRACCINSHFKPHSNMSYCTWKLKVAHPKNEHANIESSVLKLRYLKRGKAIDLRISAIYLYHVCVFTWPSQVETEWMTTTTIHLADAHPIKRRVSYVLLCVCLRFGDVRRVLELKHMSCAIDAFTRGYILPWLHALTQHDAGLLNVICQVLQRKRHKLPW
jgi:hypothetical protein